MRSVLLVTVACLLASSAVPRSAHTQTPPAPAVTQDQLTGFAKAWVAVAAVRDKAHAELADPRNKKIEDQARLRDRLRADIAAVLRANGLTQAEFDRLTQAVSVDGELRKRFDALLVELEKKPAP